MFGNFIESALSGGNMPWGAVLGVCIPALLFFIWDARKHWRQGWWYVIVLFVLFACFWRWHIGAGARRYYAVLVVPLMLLVFNMFWGIRAAGWKKIAACAFTVLLVVCIVRDFRGRFYEYRILSLYEKVAADAGNYSSPSGIAFPSGGVRERFYSGLRVEGIADDKKMLPEFLRAQKGNLDIYGANSDALYLFVFIPKNFLDKEATLRALMPDGVEIIGHEYIDRKHKKELWVVKYLPRRITVDSSTAQLLPNGDFSRLLTGAELEKRRKYLARRAPRFATEVPNLPVGWELYQPLTSFNKNWGGVERRESKNVLHLQTDSYIVAKSPNFKINGETMPRIFFKVKAIRQSKLEIARAYRDPGAEFSIMFKLFLPAGYEDEYSFVLPPSAKGHHTGQVNFWLTDGDIELSDVRIQ